MKPAVFLILPAMLLFAGCQTSPPQATPEAASSPNVSEMQSQLPLPASPPPVPDATPPENPLASPEGSADTAVSPIAGETEDEVIYCTADVQECPDGTFVARDAENDCEFKACPGL